jgi:hypothetical protein
MGGLFVFVVLVMRDGIVGTLATGEVVGATAHGFDRTDDPGIR